MACFRKYHFWKKYGKSHDITKEQILQENSTNIHVAILRAETFAIINYCPICFCDWNMKKKVFYRIKFYDLRILWKKCGRYAIYVYMGKSIRLSYREIYFVKTFTPSRCLCGVINFSAYWNDDYTSTVFCIYFFLCEVSHSK